MTAAWQGRQVVWYICHTRPGKGKPCEGCAASGTLSMARTCTMSYMTLARLHSVLTAALPPVLGGRQGLSARALGRLRHASRTQGPHTKLSVARCPARVLRSTYVRTGMQDRSYCSSWAWQAVLLWLWRWVLPRTQGATPQPYCKQLLVRQGRTGASPGRWGVCAGMSHAAPVMLACRAAGKGQTGGTGCWGVQLWPLMLCHSQAGRADATVCATVGSWHAPGAPS